MKSNPVIQIVAIAIISLVAASCGERGACPQDSPFCQYVVDQQYEATGELINDFLETQGTDETAALENLQQWLECKSCVTHAEILCNSCIETYPPQSEISVTFLQDTTLVMDIWMGEPFRFLRFH